MAVSQEHKTRKKLDKANAEIEQLRREKTGQFIKLRNMNSELAQYKVLSAQDAYYIKNLEKINLQLCGFANMYRGAIENGTPVALCEEEWTEVSHFLAMLAENSKQH